MLPRFIPIVSPVKMDFGLTVENQKVVLSEMDLPIAESLLGKMAPGGWCWERTSLMSQPLSSEALAAQSYSLPCYMMQLHCQSMCYIQ